MNLSMYLLSIQIGNSNFTQIFVTLWQDLKTESYGFVIAHVLLRRLNDKLYSWCIIPTVLPKHAKGKRFIW